MSRKVCVPGDIWGTWTTGYVPDSSDIAQKADEAVAEAKKYTTQQITLLCAQKADQSDLEDVRIKIGKKIVGVEARVRQSDDSIQRVDGKVEAVSSRIDKVRADLVSKIESGGKLEQVFRDVSDAQIKRIDKKTDEFRKEATALIASATEANKTACITRDAVKISQDQIVKLHDEVSRLEKSAGQSAATAKTFAESTSATLKLAGELRSQCESLKGEVLKAAGAAKKSLDECFANSEKFRADAAAATQAAELAASTAARTETVRAEVVKFHDEIQEVGKRCIESTDKGEKVLAQASECLDGIRQEHSRASTTLAENTKLQKLIEESAKRTVHSQELAQSNANEVVRIRKALEAELTAVRNSNEDLVGDNRTLRKRLTFVMSVGAAAVVLLGVGNTYVLTRMPARFPRNEVVPQALQMPAVPASEAKPPAAVSEPSTNSAGAPAKAQQPAVTQPQESPTTCKPVSSSSAEGNPASQTVSSEKHDG